MYVDDGFTIWHYKSAAPLSQVLDRGYFDTAAGDLGFGHLIYVQTRYAFAQLVVIRIADGEVTVSQMGSAVHLPSGRLSNTPSAAEAAP